MEIKGLEIDSRQCQLHASHCIPSCKLALFSSGTLTSGCSHTSESQSVSGSEDGPSGAAPSCAVLRCGGPALTPSPSCAVSGLWGQPCPRWRSPTWSWLVGLRPPSSLSQPPTGVKCVAPRIRVSVVSSLAPSWEGETLHVVPRPRFTPRGLAHCTVALPPLAPAGPSPPVDHTSLLQPTGQHHGHGYHPVVQ